jgi:hypothetical protein
MALTTGIVANTGAKSASLVLLTIDNHSLIFSFKVIFHIYVWNDSNNKILAYTDSITLNPNTSYIETYNISGNYAYEIQFVISGQQPGEPTTDTVISVFGLNESGDVIPHQAIYNRRLTTISQINP